jgi:hypothetical protein
VIAAATSDPTLDNNCPAKSARSPVDEGKYRKEANNSSCQVVSVLSACSQSHANKLLVFVSTSSACADETFLQQLLLPPNGRKGRNIQQDQRKTIAACRNRKVFKQQRVANVVSHEHPRLPLPPRPPICITLSPPQREMDKEHFILQFSGRLQQQ